MKYVAFLRGINVGGRRRLPMTELASLCTGIRFSNVRTYINSGNVLFESDLSEEMLRTMLEEELREKTGKKIPVVIRSMEELRSILSGNPFPGVDPSKVGVLLFASTLKGSFSNNVVNDGPEEIVPSEREVYIYYPNGMGRSKLKFRGEEEPGTMRNINTIGKLTELNSG